MPRFEKLKLPTVSVSPKFFLYFILVLVLVVLIAEGSFYWFSLKKSADLVPVEIIDSKIKLAKDYSEATYSGGLFSYAQIKDQSVPLLVGVVRARSGLKLLIEKDSEKVWVTLRKDSIVYIHTPNSNKEEIEKTDSIRPGDFINIGGLEISDGQLFGNKVDIIKID